MIRLLHAYFPRRTLFLGVSEAFLVTLAFVVAAIAMLGANAATLMLSDEQGLFKILFVSAAFVTCFYCFDLYDSSVLTNRREVLKRFSRMLGTAYLFFAVLYYLYPALDVGRGIFPFGFVLVALLLLLSRHFFLIFCTLPQFAKRALILGEGPLAEALTTELGRHSEFGLRVVGHLKGFEDRDGMSALVSGERELQALLSRTAIHKPAHLLVALAGWRERLPGEAVLQLKNQGVTIQDGAELYEAITGKVPIDCVGSSGLLSCSGPRASLPWLIYQTIAPPVFSSICLVLSLPVMALIAVAIRLDSRGPAIFRQQRVGQHGKVFTLYKFRTMVDGADPVDRYRPAQITDPRCTRVGRLLRRSRLDELPQLFNICRGEMRFVGPRPFVPNQEQECLEGIRNYRQRWAVKPGATGWAQVNRGYCVSMRDNQEKLAYDLFYIKNASFGLDLLILLKTIKLLLLRRGGR